MTHQVASTLAVIVLEAPPEHQEPVSTPPWKLHNASLFSFHHFIFCSDLAKIFMLDALPLGMDYAPWLHLSAARYPE